MHDHVFKKNMVESGPRDYLWVIHLQRKEGLVKKGIDQGGEV